MKLRDYAVAVVVPVLVALALSLPLFDRMRGLSVDLLFLLRNSLLPEEARSTKDSVVVIAIDEATYLSDVEPFRGTPRVFWTEPLARVLEAVVAAEASVVGFDLILPTSIRGIAKDSEPENLFIAALGRARKQSKVVLGSVSFGNRSIVPHGFYQSAVLGREQIRENIRSLNVVLGPDGVIRFVPLQFRSAADGSFATSMSLEVARRFLGVDTRLDSEGFLWLGDYRVPAMPDPGLTLDNGEQSSGLRNDLLVDLYRGPASFQTHSLVDLFLCLRREESAAYFQRHFAGKAVMVGLTTDVEDRKLTAVRYGQSAEQAVPVEPCAVQSEPPADERPRKLIPGVYLHAAAISNLVDNKVLRLLEDDNQTKLTAAVALIVGLSAMKLSSLYAGLAFLITTLAWVGIAVLLFTSGIVVPLISPVVASGVTVAALMGYRFAVTDRTARHIRQAFGRVLAPSLVERMVQSNQMPTQGGELREITVWVSDLQNYTTISEILSPSELVDFLNEVYTVMSDTVEEYEGFVAQFVGDAVVAGFNVPLDDADHARHGIESAIACCQRVEQLNREMDLPEGFDLRIRVGISTGDLLVGYIGSKRRLSYTIVGDDINLASRLEGVNKVFGSTILVNEITKDLCGSSIAFREVDVVRVKGRDAPVRIFEPLGPSEAIGDDVKEIVSRYAEGLAAYRDRRFEEAVEIFEALAERDPVAASLLPRAKEYAETPPPEDWDGVLNLLSK